MEKNNELLTALVGLKKQIHLHLKMDVKKHYSLMVADAQAAKAIHNAMTATERFLRQTHADQGGECSFEEWVRATAEDETEYGHDEAKQYTELGGDLSDKEALGIDEVASAASPRP